MEQKFFACPAEVDKGSNSYVSDMDNFEMLYMTEGAMKLFGLEGREDYCGQKCYQLLHGAEHPCTFCTNRVLRASRENSWIQYNQRLHTWMSIAEKMWKQDGKSIRSAQMQVIERSRIPELKDQVQQMKMENILLQCVQTLTIAGDLNTAISAFLEMIGRFYCADRAYIIEFDLEQQILSSTFEWCAEGITSGREQVQGVSLDVVREWILRFEDQGEFIVSSVEQELAQDPLNYRILKEQGVESLAAIPLYIGSSISGFIGVDNPETNVDNKNLLRAAADFIVVEMDRRRVQERLERLSFTDGLTGVYNRNRYVEMLERYQRKVPSSLGIIMVDINGMKKVNDNFGHQYGDAIIIKTAEILQTRMVNEVYRIGGDEFLVLCPDVDRDELLAMVEDLRAAFREKQECNVSIGSSWAGDQVDVDGLVTQADELMYAEKQMYYHDVVMEGSVTLNNPAADLIKEIEEKRFVVYYQPQIDLETGEIIGAEALVRKLDEEGNIIPPLQFIPYYEARNIQMHLDIHVMDMALADLHRIQELKPGLRMSVNISRSTLLLPDFVKNILEMCKKHGVKPSDVMLEVTETIATIGRETLSELLQEVHDAGFLLSLDDFGTEYSNLAILADMEFDEIKFDKSLVDDVCRNTRDQVIVKNLMRMCRELRDAQILAEGIESEEQAELLREYFCNYGQGFHFHRPMPLERYVELLKG